MPVAGSRKSWSNGVDKPASERTVARSLLLGERDSIYIYSKNGNGNAKYYVIVGYICWDTVGEIQG